MNYEHEKGDFPMRFISWNVNGLRACLTKGFPEFFQQIDADIFCLQETKLQQGQVEMVLPGYRQYWNSAVKKGYSGTAVFSKKEPLSVSYGLGMRSMTRRDGSSPWNFQLLFDYSIYAQFSGRIKEAFLSYGVGGCFPGLS